MRTTKRISKDCLEVVFKDSNTQRIYPSHDWWYVFLKLADLEDLQEPKPILAPEDDQDYCLCPTCKTDLGFQDDYMGDITDIKNNTRFCQKCGQRLCI